MIIDLVIDQALHFREREKCRKKMLLVLAHFSPRVGAVTAWRGGGEDIMDWKMSHESSHWQNTTSFQYEFKEHSGEKVSVRDVPKSHCVVRGQHRRLSSVWRQMPKPEKGGTNTTAAEGEHLVWLHPSAVFTADTNSRVNSHSISSWFYPGSGCVSRPGGAGAQEHIGAV